MDFCALHGRYCRHNSKGINSFLADINEKKTVNLISGFLGSGKTTMINNIMNQPTALNIDVIIREFGRVSIDDRLLKVSKDRIHTFSGVSFHETRESMLGTFLESLYDRSDRHPFDHLLIETSGAESPDKLLQIFLQPHTRDLYKVGSFITVVDAEYGLLNLQEFKVAREQLIYADVCVINKVDLVGPRQIDELITVIRRINPYARIIQTSFGEVNLEDVMEIELYEQITESVVTEQTKGEQNMEEIKSVSLVIKEPLDFDKVNRWICDVFEQYGAQLLRGKGFFNISGSDYRFEFQSVRRSFHSKTEDLWEDEDSRQTVVVFIGKQIPSYEVLFEGLSACKAE